MGWTGLVAMDKLVREGGRKSGDGTECKGKDYFEVGFVGRADGGWSDAVVLVEGREAEGGTGGISYVVVIEMGTAIYERDFAGRQRIALVALQDAGLVFLDLCVVSVGRWKAFAKGMCPSLKKRTLGMLLKATPMLRTLELREPEID